MPEDMSSSGSSWNLRHLLSASSRLISHKGGVADPSLTRHAWRSSTDTSTSRGLEGSPAGEHERQTWRTWADKIRGKRKGSDGIENTEVINVFPGWAARRYAQDTNTETPRPFEVEVYVSGYAISHRPPENITRSQRAFIRLAKGFASLPKLIEDPDDRTAGTTSLVQLTPSTEALLAQVKLPPRPSEITDDFDVQVLERQLKRATSVRPTKINPDAPYSDSSSLPSSASSSRSSMDMPNHRPPFSETKNHIGARAHAHAQTMPLPGTSSTSAGISSSTPTDVIRRLHTNLERRLQPFWSSTLPNRTIRLHLFPCPHQDSGSAANSSQSDKFTFDPEHGPLASQDVVTGVDGSFQAKFRVGWDDLCQHPKALHIAFGEDMVEHELRVVAQLLPPAIPVGVAGTQNQTKGSSVSPYASAPGTFDPTVLDPQLHNQIPQPPKPLTSITVVPITHSPIRVISDIDDTIKLSNVLSGARTVFHNVFVKELRDNVIPGMGEWYTKMWNRGVRFHYVSNGPFEILPIINEFFQISQIPPGSIKLKSYAGRSLFNGLLSAPAARKRAGVVDILDSFPDSQFFLIGDTGEQDLELYADLARERPGMILGVLVRDADSGNAEREPIDDPTGWKAIGAAGTRPSENPLIPIRSDSTATNTSMDRMMSSNSGSNLEDQTPRPNRYMFEGEEALLVQDKWSTEPESLIAGSGGISKASVNSHTPRQTYPLGSHRLPEEQPIPPQNPHITQAPEPIQPPCISANFMSKTRSSLSSQSPPQRINGASPDSSATSSLNNNTVNYGGKMTEVEKRRWELQLRVYRARTQMPSHIVLRVFREPGECVEVEEMLQRQMGVS